MPSSRRKQTVKKGKEDAMHILFAVILFVLFPAASNSGASPPQVAVAATPESRSEPQVFAPGIISSAAHDSAPAFTPNGDTVYFSRSNTNFSIILESRLVHGQWSNPTPAPFSGFWNDMEPAMSPDGKFLVFVSSRPVVPGGQPLGTIIFRYWRLWHNLYDNRHLIY